MIVTDSPNRRLYLLLAIPFAFAFAFAAACDDEKDDDDDDDDRADAATIIDVGERDASQNAAGDAGTNDSGVSGPNPPGPCQGFPLPASQHFVADGLCASVVAFEQGELRQIAFAPNGDLFGVLVSGQVRRYRDIDADGAYASNTPEIIDWADTGGNNGHNVHIDTTGGFIYAGTPQGVKRWRYTAALDSGGPGEDVMVGQPSSGTHRYHPVHVYDGMMYVDSGSANNIVHPMDPQARASNDYDTVRAVIKRFDLSTFTPGTPLEWSAGEVYARGLRNVVGFTRDASGRLYGVMNGIDGLRYQGRDISTDNPGDTLVLIDRGGRYGYPYCFSANFVRTSSGVVAPGTQLAGEAMNLAEPMQPFMNPHDDAWCQANSTPPLTNFQAHTAPLDIALAQGMPASLPASLHRGAFVALHGSWNRVSSVGHNIVFVPFDASGRPAMATTTSTGVVFSYVPIFGGGSAGQFRDGLWSWTDGTRGETRVRPVGVAISPLDGALFVSSDNGRINGMPSANAPNGAIYRISRQQ